MKILFDNGTPRPIARILVGHSITQARRLGWHELRNGELIQKAEAFGSDVLLTTDNQQHLLSRKIVIVVLTNQQWPAVRLHLERSATTVSAAQPGTYVEVEIPYLP